VANTKTAKKQILVSRRNAERNRHYKSTMLSAIKNARAIIEAGENAQEAKKAVDHAVKTLHRTATRNIINRKHASRNIRRLMLAYNKAFSEQAAEDN
jgi:small subunit ribosomal protein S20